MATIILSSVGSLLGPVGKVVGALAGNAIDNALFGADDIEGARLKELAVSGSSYGTPIARQYGTMRVPGTIIWSTDLEEHRDKQGNGKGQPKTVTYSYSVSFAVALSSRPIETVGRIWADGNLLRGASGGLKSGGSFRIHRGHGDQQPDPLLEADLGDQCPAFRGCAYVVFEDLDLTDFGNRIPSLSFEVVAGDASRLVELVAAETKAKVGRGVAFNELSGFGYEGGSARDVLRLLDRLRPLAPVTDRDGLTLKSADTFDAAAIELAPPASWDEGDFGTRSGHREARGAQNYGAISSLRYYDPSRDYQPGLQHADTGSSASRIFHFPGALAASDAQSLVKQANVRASVAQDAVSWRCAELDPAIEPGSLVQAPGLVGIYMVSGWEWRERGVELELTRHRAANLSPQQADPGSGWTPPDREPVTTQLRVFETPWDGFESSATRTAYVAASAAEGLWSGCALYAQRDGALVPLGQSARVRAISGTLDTALSPSSAVRYEPGATIRLRLLDHDAQLISTDPGGLAQGDNRLLIGAEVVQFMSATALGDGVWELSGLLRGRGGTEIEAAGGHDVGTKVTLLDDNLIVLPDDTLSGGTESFAAIGLWDEIPVLANLENGGASLRPPSPVHPAISFGSANEVILTWKRRARGQWLWLDEVEQPLVEELELYEVGYGPVSAPLRSWSSTKPLFQLSATEATDLLATFGSRPFWVRQIGSHAKSIAIFVGTLS